MTPEELVEFAEGLARIAASGGGPTALAAHVVARLGGGVLIEDAQWRVVAAAGPDGMPATGRSRDGLAGATLPIAAGNAQLGWLSHFGESSGEHALRLAASAIAVELARSGEGGRGKRRAFWEQLLAGGFGDAGAVRDDANARGIKLAPQYLAIALETEPPDDAAESDAQSTNVAALRAAVVETFRSGDADLGSIERDSGLLLFVPVARELDASNARTAATLLPKSLARRKAGWRISGGVGTLTPPLEIARSAGDAQAALAIARRIFGGGRVAVYEELGAYPLLWSDTKRAALEGFASETLAPLRAYDEKHQTELERTLKLYFDLGQNVKTAAAHLSVHRHTVFYRLRQIAEITGRSLESPHDQLTLRLAIAIDALHTD